MLKWKSRNRKIFSLEAETPLGLYRLDKRDGVGFVEFTKDDKTAFYRIPKSGELPFDKIEPMMKEFAEEDFRERLKKFVRENNELIEEGKLLLDSGL